MKRKKTPRNYLQVGPIAQFKVDTTLPHTGVMKRKAGRKMKDICKRGKSGNFQTVFGVTGTDRKNGTTGTRNPMKEYL